MQGFEGQGGKFKPTTRPLHAGFIEASSVLTSGYAIVVVVVHKEEYMYFFTRCSAIAERPRCRVRYSFRQK